MNEDTAPAGTTDLTRNNTCLGNNYLVTAGRDQYMHEMTYMSQPWGTPFSDLYTPTPTYLYGTKTLGTENKVGADNFDMEGTIQPDYKLGDTLDTKLKFKSLADID